MVRVRVRVRARVMVRARVRMRMRVRVRVRGEVSVRVRGLGGLFAEDDNQGIVLWCDRDVLLAIGDGGLDEPWC